MCCGPNQKYNYVAITIVGVELLRRIYKDRFSAASYDSRPRCACKLECRARCIDHPSPGLYSTYRKYLRSEPKMRSLQETCNTYFVPIRNTLYP
jgi:hypothetical protein